MILLKLNESSASLRVVPLPSLLSASATTSAATNESGRTPATPARRTKTLKGIGGGNMEGTMTTRRPYFWNQASARSMWRSWKRRRRNASPPFRPRVYNA